jgi:hypothetical protein
MSCGKNGTPSCVYNSDMGASAIYNAMAQILNAEYNKTTLPL